MEQENNHEKRRGGKNRNWVEGNVHGSCNPNGTENMPVVQKDRYYIQQEMNREIMVKKLLIQ